MNQTKDPPTVIDLCAAIRSKGTYAAQTMSRQSAANHLIALYYATHDERERQALALAYLALTEDLPHTDEETTPVPAPIPGVQPEERSSFSRSSYTVYLNHVETWLTIDEVRERLMSTTEPHEEIGRRYSLDQNPLARYLRWRSGIRWQVHHDTARMAGSPMHCFPLPDWAQAVMVCAADRLGVLTIITAAEFLDILEWAEGLHGPPPHAHKSQPGACLATDGELAISITTR